MGKIISNITVEKKAWDKAANFYNDMVAETGDVNHRIYLNPLLLKLFGNVKNKKILDVACGNGYIARMLAKKGAKVSANDISPNLIKIAQKSENKNPLGIKYQVRSIDKLSGIENKEFDLVIANLAFQVIKETPKGIKECARVLKPEGRLIISMIHPLNIAGAAKREKDKNGYYLRVMKYLSEVSVPHTIFPKNTGVIIYHRPIQYYLQNLIKAGISLTGFYEIPIKHSNGKPVKDKDFLAYKKEIPLFLVIEGTKIKPNK